MAHAGVAVNALQRNARPKTVNCLTMAVQTLRLKHGRASLRQLDGLAIIVERKCSRVLDTAFQAESRARQHVARKVAIRAASGSAMRRPLPGLETGLHHVTVGACLGIAA